MLGRVLTITVGTEGIDTSEGVFKQDPLLIWRLHILCIITLDICEPRAVIVFHPYIVERRRTAAQGSNHGISYRHCPYGIHCEIRNIDMLDSSVRHVAITFERACVTGIVGQKLRRVIRNPLYVRLPCKEISLQEISRRIGEVVDTRPYSPKSHIEQVSSLTE